MPTLITIQTTGPAAPGPFELWQIEAGPSPDGESFGIGDDEAVWSVSLSGDTVQAQQTLAARLETVNQRQEAIGVAGAFLQSIEIPADDGLAFALGPTADLTPEEEALLTTMANYSELATAESFAFDWLTRWRKPIDDWDETLIEYQQFMDQVVYLLKPTIRIETEIERKLLAHTVVRADGDMETVLHHQAVPAQMALHRQTTQLTLETRLALALFLSQVSAGAASLSAKFYVAQWAALPAAFRFARDIMRRAREDQLLSRMKELRARKVSG